MYKDPDFDLNDPGFNSAPVPGQAVTKENGKDRRVWHGHDSSTIILCHDCGEEGHYDSGCAVSSKLHGKAKKAGGGARPNKKLEVELVGKNGAQCTKQHTATLRATCKELRARK